LFPLSILCSLSVDDKECLIQHFLTLIQFDRWCLFEAGQDGDVREGREAQHWLAGWLSCDFLLGFSACVETDLIRLFLSPFKTLFSNKQQKRN
jgi:hypothetical protein